MIMRRKESSVRRWLWPLAGLLCALLAAGWGEEPLPGFHQLDAEQVTVSRVRPRLDPGRNDPETRLGPYLDALRTGGVGSRRAAAEGLQKAKDGMLVNPQPYTPAVTTNATPDAAAPR